MKSLTFAGALASSCRPRNQPTDVAQQSRSPGCSPPSRRDSMSRRIHRHGRRTGLVLAAAMGLACTASGVAQASTVDLGTVKSFVVLGGSTVTNTGPSVLSGDLGVSPGTALVGFGAPAVVHGAVHATDGVAAQAQQDLTTAYDVAAAQPVAPADDLTG